MIKKLIFPVLFVLILAVIAAFVKINSTDEKSNFFGTKTNQLKTDNIAKTPSPFSGSVKITVDFGNGKKEEGDLAEAANAFEVLKKFTAEKNIRLDAKAYDFGMMVNAIGDKSNSNSDAWLYFINGQGGKVAADKYLLHTGDTVEWKYTKIGPD